MMRVEIAGMGFDNLSLGELLDVMAEIIRRNERAVITPVNVDCFVKAHQDAWYMGFINRSRIITADGMPLVWLSKLFRRPLKQRLTGADLLVEACRQASMRGWRIFFYGADTGIADHARRLLNEKYHMDNIVGSYSPPFRQLNQDEESEIVELINASECDIIFVALGSPKQERWIEEHLATIKAKIFISCGAGLDFIVELKKRAPVFIQNLGFEWLWRLFSEPRRLFKRYFIEDVKFFGIIFKYFLDRKSS